MEERQQVPLCSTITEVESNFRGGTNRESSWVTHRDLLKKFSLPEETTSPIFIAETFTSIQGEGAGTGYSAFFIRTTGCTLECEWCDSKWARPSASEELAKFPLVSVEELAFQIVNQGWPYIVITGGEPLMYQHQLSLVLLLARGAFLKKGHKLFVEVETNATLIPSPLFVSMVDRFNVSPKLKSSGIKNAEGATSKLYEKTISTWRTLAKNDKAHFKFVSSGKDNIQEIKEFVKHYKLPREKCWLMPLGANKRDIMLRHRQVMDLAREERFNFSSRLHIISYGNRKGV